MHGSPGSTTTLAGALWGWWEGPNFERFLADLMRAELARVRPDLAPYDPALNAATSFSAGPLQLDSIDRLKLASAVAAALHFSGARVPDRLRQLPTFGEWVSEARRVAEASDGAVAFHSSGSTGAPCTVLHALAVLDQEVRVLADLLGPRTRIVAVVPAHHIYGFLFTVLLPHFWGCAVLDARGASPAALGAAAQPGDLLVAFPTVWTAAVQALVRWPGDVLGVSSGAACPPALFGELRLGGLRALFDVFGATETGGIGWRCDGAAAFRLFGNWSRLADDRLLKNGAGYRLQDEVIWVDEHRLLPGRRHDRAVQVCGLNVSPSRVRSVLLAHAEVADADVRLMRPDEGERLKAFVVPRDPAADRRQLQGSLTDWVATRLTVAERPRSFTFGAALPLTAQDKPADWSV